MNPSKKPTPEEYEKLPQYRSVPPGGPGNGHPVRPDTQTKRHLGVAFSLALAVMSFLGLQVWNLNGKMEKNEERDRIREEQLRDLRTELREMRTEFRQAIEGLRQDMKAK